MMSVQQMRGVIVPVVTPFTAEGQLDWESYAGYISGLLNEPIQGVVVNGTTGESPTVSWEEAAELTKETRKLLGGKPLPLIVGTGTNDTASTARRTYAAGQLGADAVLVVVPYYSRPSQAGIIEHFRAAAQTGVPVIVYEIPARTGVHMTVDTAKAVMELDGVIGMKDVSGSTGLVTELARCGSKPVLCGDDALYYDMLRCGAAGGMLASASVRTQEFVDIWRLAGEGKWEEARHLFEQLLPTIRLLFQEPNPAPLKWLLARTGVIRSAAMRLPMMPITSGLETELARIVPLSVKSQG